METNYKISIPKPCHEDWNQMTPDQIGRFCNSCSKSVVDFTKMETPEIERYFIKNQGKKVCGRFRNEQLDSIIIQIPREVLFSQVQFHKIFMLALLVSMGTTLFSCQNSKGDKQKIEKVEVVDSIRPTMGKPVAPTCPVKTDSISTKKVKPLIQSTTGEIVTSGLVSIDPKIANLKSEKKEVYNLNEVEVRPYFPGGEAVFYKFISNNIVKPENDEGEGQTAIASFVIDKTGVVKDIKILRGTNEKLNNEIKRVLKTCPKWTPAEYKNEKVDVKYLMPVRIQP